MEIIRPDWGTFSLYNSILGAHLFEKERGLARIYIHDGLDVDDDIRGKFHRKDSQGFVGHCLIVFYGVKKFDFVVFPYSPGAGEDGRSIWHSKVEFNYVGDDYPHTNKYEFEGGLMGIPSSASIELEAQGFEIHIYGKDKPLPESLLPAV
jgi:hypothetical protein